MLRSPREARCCHRPPFTDETAAWRDWVPSPNPCQHVPKRASGLQTACPSTSAHAFAAGKPGCDFQKMRHGTSASVKTPCFKNFPRHLPLVFFASVQLRGHFAKGIL